MLVGICSALLLLERVLGDLDVSGVVYELFRIVRGEVPCSEEAMPSVLQRIFDEWQAQQIDPPGVFDVTGTQVVYSTRRGSNRQTKKDRSFQCVIKSSQDQEFTVMIWHFSSTSVGRNTLSMKTTDGMEWHYDLESVSEEGQRDPIALAEAGAEIIGELIQRGILGPESKLAQASDEHTRLLAGLKQQQVEPAA